ncbi:MAG: mandelate racemase/muconate lactonizing enzyme family protein [Alphaproteobacteria bacterium]|nr:mandelate racemase/muconate lactonizing enzyme family protein [Alphaproteobacteria bacterium]
MKITNIRATPVNIPFTAPYRFSYGSMASLTKTVVEVETDAGVTGLGEVANGDRAADVEALSERLVGLDVREVTLAEQRTVPQMLYSPWNNAVAARRAFGGIEMALWDARGKIEGVPIYTLLGGAVRKQIALTEYFAFRLPGETDPGESTATEIANFCARMIERFGARWFEGKVATVALSEELKMVSEVRAAIGERQLQLDANGAWTVPTARSALRQLDRFNIHAYEDPVETYAELAQLRGATQASFSTHIINLPEAVRLKAPDTIVTNLNELGGIKRTAEFVSACARFNVGFRFHSGETGIASTAYLHVSAAVEHIREPSQTLLRWYGDDVIAEGLLAPHDGHLTVPEGPGLGVTLDPKALKRCHERYLAEGAFPSASPAEGYGGGFRKM